MKYISYHEARQKLLHCTSRERMTSLISLFETRQIRPEHRIPLIGDWWSMCDDIGFNKWKIHRYVTGHFAYHPSVHKNIPRLMRRHERVALASLPEIVTVYRGCNYEGRNGICWSLDKDVAKSFPFFDRYKVNNPILVTARIRRDRVLALKLDRNEHEVICFNPKRISIEPLTEPKSD